VRADRVRVDRVQLLLDDRVVTVDARTR